MPEQQENKKTILFAPLNWGLGHVSRLIPLIKEYEKKNYNILLASDGDAFLFLKNEFPKNTVLNIPSLPLKYSKRPFLLDHIRHLLPNFFRNIKSDHAFLKQLVKQEKIDLIISDNRYGFWHPNIKSIIVSHQLQLAYPKALLWSKNIVQKQLNRWINQFDECWIMDNEQHEFAGKLSSTFYLKIPYRFLGLQSRFTTKQQILDIDILVIISGIEPQRRIFEDLLIEALYSTQKKCVIVGGQFKQNKTLENIEYISFASSDTLNLLINKSKIVISRSGYSSIMDLLKLQKKAILVPTAGQPEQEYLAKLHSKNPNFRIAENSIKSISEKINSF